MISLFIFKSNARGMQYGMGTYLRELTDALLSHTDIKLYIVTYSSSESKEFITEAISSRFFKVNIPSPVLSSPQNNLFDKRYASIVVKLLCDIIPQNGDVVFQMNHVNDLPIIKKLKEKYTHPILSVVHISQWQQLFNGNRQKLNGLDIDKPTNNIEFTLSREKEMYQLSDHIISLNRCMKDFLVDEYGINSKKIDIVPNGLEFDRFRAILKGKKLTIKHNLGFSPNERIILFSGRIDPDKGIFFLLDAFNEACKQMDNLRLVIIGQGDIQKCLQKYQSFYGRITFTGFIPSSQLIAFYHVADVGVVPSLYEQCPYTVLEMMAYKIPLVLSKINGLDEMLDSNQCLFIDPVISKNGEISFDIKEFSNAILALVRDNQMAENLALKAYTNMVSKFSASRMEQKMNNLYHTLINSNKMTLEYENNERR